MLRRAYSVFLIINIFNNKSASCFDSFYAVRTNDYPKSSCHKIANIETAGECLLTCKISVDAIVMISHDISAKICMCCNDITGSDISGSNWKNLSNVCITVIRLIYMFFLNFIYFFLILYNINER